MDKLQALLDAAEEIALGVLLEYDEKAPMSLALRDLRTALASGEVVVTTWEEYSDDCSHHPITGVDIPELGVLKTDKTQCANSLRVPGDACTRTNCPRLPHA